MSTWILCFDKIYLHFFTYASSMLPFHPLSPVSSQYLHEGQAISQDRGSLSGAVPEGYKAPSPRSHQWTTPSQLGRDILSIVFILVIYSKKKMCPINQFWSHNNRISYHHSTVILQRKLKVYTKQVFFLKNIYAITHLIVTFR